VLDSRRWMQSHAVLWDRPPGRPAGV
jgi:hypothetical protein